MRKKTIVSVVVMCAAFCNMASARTVQDLNVGWRFAPDGWDGVSRTLDLPHDFQLEMPWREDAGGNRGFKPMGAS